MGKKIDRAEPKKECPSCGLGVSLEANMCEFCGWDFEEEDEWILQIEKLERELMLEKKKFEPGTVDHKIEGTLRTPAKERAAASHAEEPPVEASRREEREAVPTAVDLMAPEARPSQEAQAPAAPEPVRKPSPGLPMRKVRSVKASAQPSAPPREPVSAEPKFRKVKLPQERPQQPSVEQAQSRKVRTVRKVK